jgi:hypothetical protein
MGVEQNNHKKFQLIDTDIKKGTNEFFAGVGYFYCPANPATSTV